MSIKKLLCLLIASLLLLMLSACSSKPQVQLVAPPKAPIPIELLTYCHAPVSPGNLPLQMALIVVVENHKQYADCYLIQRGLVDAVKRRLD